MQQRFNTAVWGIFRERLKIAFQRINSSTYQFLLAMRLTIKASKENRKWLLTMPDQLLKRKRKHQDAGLGKGQREKKHTKCALWTRTKGDRTTRAELRSTEHSTLWLLPELKRCLLEMVEMAFPADGCLLPLVNHPGELYCSCWVSTLWVEAGGRGRGRGRR